MSRAVVIDAYGEPEQMRIVQVEVGQPGPGEVRIRHFAIGLNFLDIYQRRGTHPGGSPMHLGMEGAGVVESVGAGVQHLSEGDRVAYACHPPGSYCDARVMPAKSVCRLPDSVSFETGAAMMLKGLTVQYLLRSNQPRKGFQPGDFVLFHAAAGGVGLIASQWARAMGLRLIGTAGTDAKCAIAAAHGAEFTVNYAREDVVARVKHITAGKGVAVAYDSVGKDTWEQSLECLRPFGMLVGFGGSSGPAAAFAPARLARKSLYVTQQGLFAYLATRESTQEMADDLFEMVTSGKVGIQVHRSYALGDIQQAHRDLEARRTTGSSVITL
jgi:NADPH2:quinone reductase